MDNQARTNGVHHVGLTVPDVETTAAFFVHTLGFHKVGERPAYPAMFVSDGSVMLTLWQARNPDSAHGFDRTNTIGLHHLALIIAAGQTLEGLSARLKEADGVVVEFEPESLGGSATRHMMCSIPGGVRVEFIAPAAK